MTNPLTTAQLGRTGLEVTSICAGGSVLGSMPSVFSYTYSEAQAIETVLALLGSGINFLDTSAGYSDGESERRIGLAIAEAGGAAASGSVDVVANYTSFQAIRRQVPDAA